MIRDAPRKRKTELRKAHDTPLNIHDVTDEYSRRRLLKKSREAAYLISPSQKSQSVILCLCALTEHKTIPEEKTHTHRLQNKTLAVRNVRFLLICSVSYKNVNL